MLIDVAKHPEIARALELTPGAKYLIVIATPRPLSWCLEFQRYLAAKGIEAVVVAEPIEVFKMDPA